jgi:hypothetical protein
VDVEKLGLGERFRRAIGTGVEDAASHAAAEGEAQEREGEDARPAATGR